ncbi:hypothetical protein CRG98_011312 [Punica granatum]|uniref:Uncharacterized protein n=1 Tax=Punica granatum TaxID=22663 RepID=A0A2I0KIE2_PUNGR|nr:hypothetical protein CRG98_011312 [Punica granatum]
MGPTSTQVRVVAHKSTPRAKASSMAKIVSTKSMWILKIPKATSTLVAPYKAPTSHGSLVFNFLATKSMQAVAQKIIIIEELIRNPYILNMSLLLLQFYARGAEAGSQSSPCGLELVGSRAVTI